jgi:hypothetical protein
VRAFYVVRGKNTATKSTDRRGFGHLKPLTELATGLIPRSNFANVPSWLGTTRPALTGRKLPELILAVSATACSSGGLGKVPLKFGAPIVKAPTLRPSSTRASLQEVLSPVGDNETVA